MAAFVFGYIYGRLCIPIHQTFAMANPNYTTHNILLVEDDEDDQEFISLALKRMSPQPRFHIASNGNELLHHLAGLSDDELPCLIVLDLNMPGLNGFQTLEALNEDPKYSKIPKVIFTTSESEKDKRRCLENGASDFVVKPNSLSEVTAAIGNMLTYCD